MRAFAILAWNFNNLAFLGLGVYLNLILSAYCRGETLQENAGQNKFVSNRSEIISNLTVSNMDNYQRKKSTFDTSNRNRRNRSNFKSCTVCTAKNPANKTKLEEYKNRLLIQLRRVLLEESNVFKMDNPYSVTYAGHKETHRKFTSDQIKCRLKKANLRLLSWEDSPERGFKFRTTSGRDFLNGSHFETCAIVSSAGSMLNSKLGRLIDEHEIVVRFNHAPTETYEKDVGTKTTIRLVNSQVVSVDKFNFTTSQLYKSVTLVVWDPSNYTATLQQWYEKPDFNFFESWAEQKRLHSKENSFILDPRSIWKVWDFIQSLTSTRIRKNPPSSGFLGLALLLPYCETVDFFEFVPSFRLTKKCHYFEEFEDESCTFGVWHPLSAEKILSLAMNEANDSIVFQKGFIRIKGYRNLKC